MFCPANAINTVAIVAIPNSCKDQCDRSHLHDSPNIWGLSHLVALHSFKFLYHELDARPMYMNMFHNKYIIWYVWRTMPLYFGQFNKTHFINNIRGQFGNSTFVYPENISATISMIAALIFWLIHAYMMCLELLIAFLSPIRMCYSLIIWLYIGMWCWTGMEGCQQRRNQTFWIHGCDPIPDGTQYPHRYRFWSNPISLIHIGW